MIEKSSEEPLAVRGPAADLLRIDLREEVECVARLVVLAFLGSTGSKLQCGLEIILRNSLYILGSGEFIRGEPLSIEPSERFRVCD